MNLAEMLAMADQATQDVDVSSATEFKPLPPGQYEVAVVAAEGPLESKRTNPNNPSEHGQYIKLNFAVTGDRFNGRRIFMNNNILVYPKSMSAEDVSRSQTAMAIGGKERKILLSSVGKNAVENVAEFIGATCLAEVVVTKDMNGNDRNEIKRILPSKGQQQSSNAATSVPSFMSAAPAQAPVAQTNVKPKNKMPWEV